MTTPTPDQQGSDYPAPPQYNTQFLDNLSVDPTDGGNPAGGTVPYDPYGTPQAMSSDPHVMTETAITGVHHGGRIDGMPASTPVYQSLPELALQFDALPYRAKMKWARKLAIAGYLTVPYSRTLQDIVKNAGFDDVSGAYAHLLSDTAQRNAAGQMVTPEQVLQMHLDYALEHQGLDPSKVKDPWKALTGAAAAGKAKTVHRSDTTTTKDIYSPSQARDLARATLQNALGRDPTEAEYADFVSSLHAAQEANPVTTTTDTTMHVNADGTSTQQSNDVTRTGGLDVQQFAYDQARENPDYAEWQAVGHYLPLVLNRLLGPAVAGV